MARINLASKRGLHGKRKQRVRHSEVKYNTCPNSKRAVRARVAAESLASAGAIHGKKGKLEAIYTYLLHFIGIVGFANSTRLPSRVRVPGIGTSGAISMVICGAATDIYRVSAQ